MSPPVQPISPAVLGKQGWRRLTYSPRLDHSRSPDLRQTALPVVLTILLAVHAGLLAYAATRHSPTLNEPGHLVAGLAMWEYGRFDVYRVNPPLTRLIAPLPVLLAGYRMDWTRFNDEPGARPEFELGAEFMKANGSRAHRLIVLARLSCIPFSLAGATFCFLWAKELYGATAGLASAAIWCFDPNILAHAELITSDAAAATTGVGASYCFWRWLNNRTWRRTIAAGVFLGLALAAKLSWILLPFLWPAIYLIWIWGEQGLCADQGKGGKCSALKMVAMLLLSAYILNSFYLFNGSCTLLGRCDFVSDSLTGPNSLAKPGNRFTGNWAGALPIPLPRDYLIGIDVQKRDLERENQNSYLRGKWKSGGWWYYYLYGAAVKTPHGWQFLLLLSVLLLVFSREKKEWRDALVLLAPALCHLLLISSQSQVSHHYRYALCSTGILMVFCARPFRHLRSCVTPARQGGAVFAVASVALASSIASSLAVFPHTLTYFNEFSGGPSSGHYHMGHSNVDWGQDAFSFRDLANPGDGVASVQSTLYASCFDTALTASLKPREPAQTVGEWLRGLPPGLYFIGKARLWMLNLDYRDLRAIEESEVAEMIRAPPSQFAFRVSPKIHGR